MMAFIYYTYKYRTFTSAHDGIKSFVPSLKSLSIFSYCITDDLTMWSMSLVWWSLTITQPALIITEKAFFVITTCTFSRWPSLVTLPSNIIQVQGYWLAVKCTHTPSSFLDLLWQRFVEANEKLIIQSNCSLKQFSWQLFCLISSKELRSVWVRQVGQ